MILKRFVKSLQATLTPPVKASGSKRRRILCYFPGAHPGAT
jgi:hypothetical protein